VLSGWLSARRVAAARPLLRGTVLDWGCGALAPLAGVVPPERYLGVDTNPESVASAARRHPNHRFVPVAPAPTGPSGGGGPHANSFPDRASPGITGITGITGTFTTVVSLAVIEHVTDPAGFMAVLASRVAPEGVLVVSTPHPRFEWVHTAAAQLRLASPHAHDDHESLLAPGELVALASAAGLTPEAPRRFLAGMNQLLVAHRPGDGSGRT
jgi:SAM-dependent methyltransferase